MGANLSNAIGGAAAGVWLWPVARAGPAASTTARADGGADRRRRDGDAGGGGDGNPLNSGIPRSHRRVLIAIDESEGAQRAFDFWSGVPGCQDDSIVLVNAVEVPNVLTGLLLSPSGSFDYSEYQRQAGPLLDRAHHLKDQMMAKCEKRHLRCKFITEVGSPAMAILDAAKTFSASVIIMGTCGVGARSHPGLIGSVSNYILQHSCRPVIVVPGLD